MTVAQHGARAFERQEPKPGWFARLHEWWMSKAPEVDDWTEPLKEPTRREPQPTAAIPQQRPAPQAQRPPMALPPRPAAHTLAFMMHRLADLLADPTLTASKAMAALQEPNAELNRMYLVEKDVAEQAQAQAETLARRSARNAEAAAAAARGLEVALATPGVRVDTAEGEGGEFVPELGTRMVQQAAHASDTTAQTGYMPRISEDMPDPRIVARPQDVNAGDVEAATSPVHEGPAPAVPESAAGLVPPQLPRRPKPHADAGVLAHEVHAPGPATVLPVQGATQTAVLPAVEETDGDDD